MILTKVVTTGLNGRNVHYYEKLGYYIPRTTDSRGRTTCKKGTKINVKITDLLITSKVRILCKCEGCGIERYLTYDTVAYRQNSGYLKDGRTLCCGCASKETSGIKNSQYIHGMARYSEYKYNARKRNINFNLTIEQFRDLIDKKCHYCGGYSLDRNPKSRGNGIDRKDSGKEYCVDNCVSCCATCNFVKNSMQYKDFILYIRQLYETTKNMEV